MKKKKETKLDINSVDLTNAEDEKEIMSIDLDALADSTDQQFIDLDTREIFEAGNDDSLIINIDELPESNQSNKLNLELNDSSLPDQVLNIYFCPGCGGTVDADKALCATCSSGFKSFSRFKNFITNPKKVSILTVSTVFIIIALIFSINQFRLDPSDPLPTIIPLPNPTYVKPVNYTNLQKAINNANDGDEIILERHMYYGPIDFKGKSLTLRLADEVGSGSIVSDVVEVSVPGAVVTIVNASAIESLLKGYTISPGKDGKYKGLVYRAETNYHKANNFPGSYVEFIAQGEYLVIEGRTSESGKWVRADIDSGTYRGQYTAQSDNNRFFIMKIKPVSRIDGIRVETVSVNVTKGATNRGPFRRFYGILSIDLYFRNKQLDKAEFTPTLAYDGNIQAWNTFRDPSLYLEADYNIQSSYSSIVEKANALVTPDMNDYQKLVAIHDWVTKNIAYDANYRATGKRLPQDAVSVLNQKVAVCAGYARLMAALLRSQGISAVYVSGLSIGRHESWEDQGLYSHRVGHAWNEVYIDGEWITVDATWNAGYTDLGSGKFVFNQSFRYFAPSIEFFSRSHFARNYR